MKALAIISVWVLASPTVSHARIGWTLEQCTKEYGKPINAEGDEATFKTPGDRYIRVIFDSNKVVQRFAIRPISLSEAYYFREELGPGWILTPQATNYAILPSPEWLKSRVGEMYGTEWLYDAEMRQVSICTEIGSAKVAKQLAGLALQKPAANEPPPPVIQAPQGVSSVRQIRRVYVDSLGADGEARLLREKVRAELLKTKRFTVVDGPSQAQGVIQGAVATRSYTSAYGSSFDGDGWVSQDTTIISSSTLRVTDAVTGKTLWTWEYQPAKVAFGPFAFGDTSVSKAFARDFSKIVYGEQQASEASNYSKQSKQGSSGAIPRR